MTCSPPSEAKTRKDLIDPALKKAGWDLANPDLVGMEIPVDGFDPAAWHALKAQLREAQVAYEVDLPAGVTDYSLYRPNGEIIAVVEAKRTSIDPRLAQAQTQFYVTQLEKRQSFRPFAFMTNGQDIYFWDVGRANKRMVMGFFSPDDLENLLYLRQHHAPLTAAPVNTCIANRSYQLEAIQRVAEVFQRGKRKALLVMATGTGKTRVAMALADLFMRSNQARRILFVADRDALVAQAIHEGFEEHLPDEPCTRIFTHSVDTTKRLYAVTLQTLSNCLGQFTPGFFDLIIFDEVHRSIFNKWNEVLQYFDGRMIGLTATPAAFIDRNTFLEFECFDGKPTFLYGHDEAVADGYLVDFELYAAQTKFQRKGIKGVDLSEEERNSLVEQGLDPDEIDFSGTDLEQRVSNRDTLRKQWQEIMDQCRKDESGQLPAKTIVFAMTQEHALRLADVFEEMYPQFPGLVQVITYKSEYKGTLIDRFKKESFPRIAISVDMLETGVNVPEVANLVFMRPVQSRIKLEQMLGRGTRPQAACSHPEWLPNGCKEDFLVVDFWENTFGKVPQEETAQGLPVLVSLFNTRLKLLENVLDRQWSDDATRIKADLRGMIERIPRESYSVKQVLPQIEQAWEEAFWQFLTVAKIDLLRLKVGPLLRYAPDVDVAKETFTHKVERLKIQILGGRDTVELAQSIAEDASRLPDFVREAPERAAAIGFCLSLALRSATPQELDHVIDTLADQMRFRKATDSAFLTLDLPDVIASRGYILLFGGTHEVYVDTYRRLVEERVLELVSNHPTVRAIEQGKAVTDRQLLDLERTLRHELAEPGIELTEANIRRAFQMRVGSLMEFVREVLELDGIPDYQDIVRRQFDAFMAGHPEYSANQLRFLRAVQNVFLQKRRLVLPDLYEPPLTSFGADAAERWFTTEQLSDVLAFVDTLTVTGG